MIFGPHRRLKLPTREANEQAKAIVLTDTTSYASLPMTVASGKLKQYLMVIMVIIKMSSDSKPG